MQISELPETSMVSDAAVFAIDQGAQTYKVPFDAIKSSIQSVMRNAFITRSYTAEYTCPANNAVGISANAFGMSTPAGYRPVAVYDLQTRHNKVVFRTLKVDATGSTNALILVNIGSEDATQTATIGVLYAKASLF